MMNKNKFNAWDARYIRLCHRASPDMNGKPYLHVYEFRIHVLSKVDMEFEQGKACAKIIAAAPDLLDALLYVENNGFYDLSLKAQQIVSAAIAKARME